MYENESRFAGLEGKKGEIEVKVKVKEEKQAV
jgi:hypothetical protein